MIPLLFTYGIVSLLFSLSRKITTYVILIGIVAVCIEESYIGILQLTGYRLSNHSLYAVTGSFLNPGMYGGALSVCESILMAFYLGNRNRKKERIFEKIFLTLVFFTAALVICVLPSSQSRSSWFALCGSLLLLAFGSEDIRVKIKSINKKYYVCFITIAALFISGAYLFKKPSADGRLFMDKMSIKTMCENGIHGAGLKRFGAAYAETQSHYFKKQIDDYGNDDLDWTAISPKERIMADCPNNSFNEYLSIGVEAGPIAMFFFIITLVAAIFFSYKRRTIWCYGLLNFALLCLFSYPLHIIALQIMFTILLAACIWDGNTTKRSKIVGIASSVLVLLVALTIYVSNRSDLIRQKHAESEWKRVDGWHKMGYYDYVIMAGDTLLPYLKNDFHFLFAYGQSLNKMGYYDKSDSILKMGTELSGDPMFWNVMGNNSLAKGDYLEAEKRYKHAFYIVPNRMYPLYLLAKLYNTEKDTLKFLKMAGSVETFIPKVESGQIDLLRMEIRQLKDNYIPEIELRND